VRTDGEKERAGEMASWTEKVRITQEELAEVQEWWRRDGEGIKGPGKRADHMKFAGVFHAYFEIQEGRASVENYITKAGEGDFHNARAKITLAEMRIKLYFELKKKGRL
jgi:hypothetical protein